MEQRVRVTLSTMTQGGDVLGRDETGRVVFVPYAIAGEEVIAEIVAAKKNFVRARVVEVLKPSPARVTPRCIHFPPSPASGGGAGGGGCGGCQWQHLAYPAQLEFKRDLVREQFLRIGQLADAPVLEPIGMPDPWHYRNHVEFKLDADGHLCFLARDSHHLVPIRECHLLHPLLDEMFHALELEGADYESVGLRAGVKTGDKMVIFSAPGETPPELEVDERVSVAFQYDADKTMTLIGNETLTEELHGRAFRISPLAFFQVNTEMAEVLLRVVKSFLNPRGDEILLDAFAGVGTFGLSLADKYARVILVEENEHAQADARVNAGDRTNVEFIAARVEGVLPKLEGRIDAVVMDPPRAGVEKSALDALISRAPREIVYVSCDPATLARDARRLVDGGYVLEAIQPVDLFPQTYHVETVSLFTTPYRFLSGVV